MSRSGWILLILWGVLPLAAPASFAQNASGEAVVPPKAGVAIGVAPFERVAPPGASVPEVASLLADRLATKGVQQVVGPSSLGARAVSDPAPDEVVEWASPHNLTSVVVGRATRIGAALSVDVQVRSGDDGGVLGTYVEEVAQPAQLGAALDRLADHVLESQGRAPAGASASRAASGDEQTGEKSQDEANEASMLRGDQPIQISSAQLEAFDQEDGKRLIFTDDVQASQGDLSLHSQRLEAFYPPNSSQPDRLVASGRVLVQQENRTAHCDKATYLRADQVLVCEGENATLTQDEDRVQGKEITFHLDTKVLTVKGGARVNIRPDSLESSEGDG